MVLGGAPWKLVHVARICTPVPGNHKLLWSVPLHRHGSSNSPTQSTHTRGHGKQSLALNACRESEKCFSSCWMIDYLLTTWLTCSPRKATPAQRKKRALKQATTHHSARITEAKLSAGTESCCFYLASCFFFFSRQQYRASPFLAAVSRTLSLTFDPI
jgi:hypothetical protein